MATKSMDLAQLFGSVTTALRETEDSLNRADEYNHDHGTNMVNTFEIITDALEAKRGSSNSDALFYAADQLNRRGTSGSARLYAQNLQQAAARARGTGLSAANALELLQTLMGGEQEREAEQAELAAAQKKSTGLGGLLGSLLGAVQTQQVQQAPSSSDIGLGGLLGGLFGGQQQVQQPVQPTGGDLGSLLGGLMGGQTQTTRSTGGGMGGILGIVSSLMGAGQATGSNAGLGALVQAFTGGSATSQSYRKQSSGVVVGTVLQAIMSMMGR